MTLIKSLVSPLRRVRQAFGVWRHWNARIRDVVNCPDNPRLHRVRDAGKVKDGFQVMHNGLLVLADAYYGRGITRMLKLNKGCHEPQEEVIFEALLKILPKGAVMLEGGAFWAFYSMWFMSNVEGSKAWLIEPCGLNLEVARRNLAQNNLQAHICQAYIGGADGIAEDGVSIVSVDAFCERERIHHIDVLHMDIQGAEASMIEGSARMLAARAIDYIFISTHSEELHEQCLALLKKHGFEVLASVPLSASYSCDGLIVSQRPEVRRLKFAPVSLKPNAS
jgi:hypothetical protein